MSHPIEQTTSKAQMSQDVVPTEAYRFIVNSQDNGEVVILDVTTAREFSRLHLENAINLNFFSLSFKGHLNALDKSKTYFVYCKIGGRSKIAQKMMKRLGFTEVYNIVGGTVLWAEENLPFAPGLKPASSLSWCPGVNASILWRRLRKLFM